MCSLGRPTRLLPHTLPTHKARPRVVHHPRIAHPSSHTPTCALHALPSPANGHRVLDTCASQADSLCHTRHVLSAPLQVPPLRLPPTYPIMPTTHHGLIATHHGLPTARPLLAPAPMPPRAPRSHASLRCLASDHRKHNALIHSDAAFLPTAHRSPRVHPPIASASELGPTRPPTYPMCPPAPRT